MKPSTSLLPVLALLTILISACGRDRAPNGSPSQDSEDFEAAPVVSAPTVAEPAPAARSGPVAAAPVKPDSGRSFTDMDKNMDSGITRDELPAGEMLYQHFSEADTSRDGRLSFAEVERHRSDMGLEPQTIVTDNRSVFQMDKNGDGGISHDELWNNEMLYRHFDEADSDADGKLSAAEVEAHRSAMASGQ